MTKKICGFGPGKHHGPFQSYTERCLNCMASEYESKEDYVQRLREGIERDAAIAKEAELDRQIGYLERGVLPPNPEDEDRSGETGW